MTKTVYSTVAVALTRVYNNNSTLYRFPINISLYMYYLFESYLFCRQYLEQLECEKRRQEEIIENLRAQLEKENAEKDTLQAK